MSERRTFCLINIFWTIIPGSMLYYSIKNTVCIKGIVCPPRKNLLWFTHPQVIPNLYDILSFAEHKRKYFDNCCCCFFWSMQWKSMITKTVWLSTLFKIPSSKRINPYIFGMAWGWVNDYKFSIFGWGKKTSNDLHASAMIKMFSISVIKFTTIFGGHNGGQNSQFTKCVPVFLVGCEIFKVAYSLIASGALEARSKFVILHIVANS